MNKFNKTQRKLVERSERAHSEGIRHSGLSGAITEDLLAIALRRAIPRLNFHRGIIKFGSRKAKEHQLDNNNLSSQIDLIVYTGIPIFKIGQNVVVHEDQVIAVIEVKKWATAKMMEQRGALTRSIRAFQKRCSAPFLFVAFRFRDKRKASPVRWNSLVSKLPAKYSYRFFCGYTRKNKKNNYPWQEGERWKKFDDPDYSGRFAALVGDIKALFSQKRSIHAVIKER